MEFIKKGIKPMKKIKKSEIYSGNSSSIWVSIFIVIILTTLILISFWKDFELIAVLSSLFLIGILIMTSLIEKAILNEKGITVCRYWTKKVLWECKYDDINRVNANYFSDTFYRSKTFIIIMKNGQVKKLILAHVMVERIAKIFLIYGIPFFIKKNEKNVPYKY